MDKGKHRSLGRPCPPLIRFCPSPATVLSCPGLASQLWPYRPWGGAATGFQLEALMA